MVSHQDCGDLVSRDGTHVGHDSNSFAGLQDSGAWSGRIGKAGVSRLQTTGLMFVTRHVALASLYGVLLMCAADPDGWC